MFTWYKDLTVDKLQQHSVASQPLGVGLGSNRHWYVPQCCGFDIETTSVITNDYAHAYMYIWSFTINDLTILGSYWEEFLELLDVLAKLYNLNEDKSLMIFIANTSFEFQFFRKRLNVTDSFFIEERIPLYFIHNEVIEFRDALQVSGGNLAYLAKNYTTTQKLVGDLDYSIPRNHQDAYKMTPEEYQYVINDTKILAEYMDYYFKTFIPKGFLPLTKTGILRKEVLQRARQACKQAKIKLPNLMSAFHPSEPLYDLMMKWLFRGGYVHGSNYTVGQVLRDCAGADITSSYPNEMNTKDNYPKGKFYRVKDTSIENYLNIIKDWAVMAVIDFYDIDVKFVHTIESKNKIIEAEEAHYDNGRLLDAKRVRVFITELDYDIYTKFYTWSKMEIRHCWKARRGRLPRYLLDTLNYYYQEKAKLKMTGQKKTKKYSLSKEIVNAGYGLTVTRMRKTTITYNSHTDEYEEDHSFVFQKEISKLSLLPQWGIWITANARHTLLNMVWMIETHAQELGRENDCYYEDTDSIKFDHPKDHIPIIEEYNKKQDEKIQALCQEYGYNYQYMKGLGNFDIEMPYIKKFKHLGAKRYCVTYYDPEDHEYKTETTISGLPKHSLIQYCKTNHISVYEAFNDGMRIPVHDTNKLASIYNDELHSDIVNGELMEEQSSVCLLPIEFTLSIKDDYMIYIDEAEKRMKQGII